MPAVRAVCPSRTIPHTIPFVETIYETFGVGVDTRTGVDDKDYQPPFRFTGKTDTLTVKLRALEKYPRRVSAALLSAMVIWPFRRGSPSHALRKWRAIAQTLGALPLRQ